VQDALGSIAIEMGSSGNLRGSQLFASYGSQRYSTGFFDTNYGFTDQYATSNSGLLYDRARYFDPTIGAFISADAVQGPNRYEYVRENPETHTDPTGREFCDCIGAGGGDVGDVGGDGFGGGGGNGGDGGNGGGGNPSLSVDPNFIFESNGTDANGNPQFTSVFGDGTAIDEYADGSTAVETGGKWTDYTATEAGADGYDVRSAEALHNEELTQDIKTQDELAQETQSQTKETVSQGDSGTKTLYRGTTYADAMNTEQSGRVDANTVRYYQTRSGYTPARGPGYYTSSQYSTAEYWAFNGPAGTGVGLGPAVIRIDIPVDSWAEFVDTQGIAEDLPVQGRPGQMETVIPLDALDALSDIATFSAILFP
jgi:RHS repeat-associated protein